MPHAIIDIILLMGLGAVITSLVLPWINRSEIMALQKKVAMLQRDAAELRTRLENSLHYDAAQSPKTDSDTESPCAGIPVEGDAMQPVAPVPSSPAAAASESADPAPDHARDKPPGPKAETPAENHVAQPRESFEHQFGNRAFVWLGAVALAFAGFFLVKYSIEAGLIGPAVRVTMGIIFGLALLYAGNLVRRKPEFSNGARIAQALSGAGIAVLYAGVYAAAGLYHLITPLAGFTGMAVITAVATALSVWYGRPIALLGLMGGFLTPALVGSPHPQASLLFSYLLLVFAGLIAVIRSRGWWSMGIPAIIGSFLWVPVWLCCRNFKPGDTVWIGVFLFAACGTVVAASKKQYEEDCAGLGDLSTATSVLNYLALCGATVLMGMTAARAGFGMTGWCLFGLLAASGMALAYANPKLYGLLPWTSTAVSSAMLAAWQYDTVREFAPVLGIIALLHVAGAYILQSRSRDPLIWGGLTGVAALDFYLIGYFKIHFHPFYSDIPLFWGIQALALAVIATWVLIHLVERIPAEYPRKQHLLAVYAGIVAAFLSIGLTIELKREFLSVAIAAEVLAVSWINTKTDIRALRLIGALLACMFGFLLIPQVLLVVQLAAFSLVEAKLYLQENIPIVNWPVFQLGVPSLCFMTASRLLRAEKDDRLVFSLEAAAIGLSGLMAYYLTRHIFHWDQNVLFIKPGFVERGVTTNVFFMTGLACLWAGGKFERKAVVLGGLVLSGIAIFRIGYFDFILHNPLFSAQNVGGLPIFNGLPLPYGLPILWIWAGMKIYPAFGKIDWKKFGCGAMLLLAFMLVSMNVRQIFHGARLDVVAVDTGNAEIYAYSAVWLLFGLVLLFFGTLRRNGMMRTASLPVVLLTVAKVFLYDASALHGLWRVLSFFCLGLCLLATSWFYSCFVFNVRHLDSTATRHMIRRSRRFPTL